MTQTSSVKWSHIKPQIEALSSAQLVALVKDLFDYSSDNRSLLAARMLPQGDSGAALEKYRKQIVDQFFPKRGFGKLRLGEARKAIRDYRKLTSDWVGAVDLMLTYVENGTRFTNEYGDIDEPFYNSLESVLDDMLKLLMTPDGARIYPTFQRRIERLAHEASGIGWGYGDQVTDQIEELENYVRAQGTPDEEPT